MVSPILKALLVFAVAASQGLAENLEYPLVDDDEALRSLELILGSHDGNTIENARERLTKLQPFIASNRSSRAALTAQLIYAGDLVSVGVANAGDEKIEEGAELFRSIIERHRDSWEGAVAAVGLLGYYSVRGNQNTTSDWEGQIEIGKALLESGALSEFSEKGDKNLSVFRIVGGSLGAGEVTKTVAGILRETFERLGRDPAELDDLLADQAGSQSLNGFEGGSQVPEISDGENAKEQSPIKAQSADSSKELPSLESQRSKGPSPWALAVIVVAVVGILVLLIRAFMRGRAS